MSQRAPSTVVVADDHPLYRAGLVEAIAERPELELTAECSGGRDAVAAILGQAPDVALVDMRMRDLDGIAVLRAVLDAGARTRIVLLSAYEDGEIMHAALAAGAAGYLSKEADRDEICDALLAAVAGEVVASASMPPALVAYLQRRAEGDALAPREREVVRLTADGLSAAQIADALGIGTTTVKTHLQRIYRKLEVTDRAAMVAKALRDGLLT